jgi:Uma2 family endonuclease
MQTLNEVENPFEWYYEMYPKEKDMVESLHHRIHGNYLFDLMTWYYRAEKHLILANQFVFRNRNLTVAPDLAVIKDVDLTDNERRYIVSWKVDPPRRPAPAFTLEISSAENYEKAIDADKLPDKYARLGVKEYFAYDPLGVWDENVRLKGWRNVAGQMQPLPMVNGRIWSTELSCWLLEDEAFLRLEDVNGKRLLTEA